MPLADLTAISNLALDHLGEPYLTAYATDTTVAAQACRLHLPQCIETVLEGHVWSFATRCSQLNEVAITSTNASATINKGGNNNEILVSAVTPGPSGNDINYTVSDTTPAGALVTIHASDVTLYINKARMTVSGTSSPGMNGVLYYAGTAGGLPFYSSTGEPYNADDGDASDITNGIYIYRCRELVKMVDGSPVGVWVANTPGATPDLSSDWGPDGSETGTVTVTASDASAQMIVDAINATTSAYLLITAANTAISDGTGTMVAVNQTYLSGGASESTVYAPSFGSAFNLPSDCLRVIKLDGPDMDIPQNRFEIQGRVLLLHDEFAEAPVIHYITKDPPVDEWPTTFTDAVAFLLASRLAPNLSQDQALAADFLQKHEIALGKARSKDSRETRSKENHGPRQLAARSGLVRARYGRSQPPL